VARWAAIVAATSGAGGAAAATPREEAVCVLDGQEGDWVEIDGTGALRISKGTYSVAEDGALQSGSPIVECDAEGIAICFFGNRIRVPLSVAGDDVTVPGAGGTPRRYRRGGDPAVFDRPALSLPLPMPLEATRVEAIQRELARRGEADQRVRTGEDVDPNEMLVVDRDNTARLRTLVLEVGWIAPDRFGETTAREAWLIVQHSGDLPLMLAALEGLDRERQGSSYALLFDRIQTTLGRPQRFGSQLTAGPDGQLALSPIEDPDNVDARRAAVGLEPLSAYLSRFGLTEPRLAVCE
jgi:hypothetical protein